MKTWLRVLAVAAGSAAALIAAPTGASAASVPDGVQSQVTETQFGNLTITFVPMHGATAVPASAFGCNARVCIRLVGSGAHVSQWNTSGINTGPLCTFASWWLNSRAILRSRTICARGAGVFFADWSPNRNFSTPSFACNTWWGIPGRPCETIHR